ncbi:hypothetical protein MES4922_10245 [Mesorhizobium ventifaucium]|uniref:Uncharacterized protein n=1 Tax=Mesorhizobium ventifaucium TaxID=666020 RepID=A0ABM9DCS7_9HYPH|nr:hypothetical protein MES4922_10245 [Mesorhizobium ventifaucium]
MVRSTGIRLCSRRDGQRPSRVPGFLKLIPITCLTRRSPDTHRNGREPFTPPTHPWASRPLRNSE